MRLLSVTEYPDKPKYFWKVVDYINYILEVNYDGYSITAGPDAYHLCCPYGVFHAQSSTKSPTLGQLRYILYTTSFIEILRYVESEGFHWVKLS